MQPSVEAILAQNPDFPTESIDIVACGSTLGNLLRFVRGIDREYRMLVEVVGSTVFLVRRENSPTQTIPDVRGFGHSFPEAYTTWSPDVKGSESHQRLIHYTFGGMKCVVRFEADGYLPDLVPDHIRGTNTHGIDDGTNFYSDQGLTLAFGNTTIGTKSAQDKGLSIKTAGSHVPQTALFDLKTRSFRKKDVDILREELPRLWLSRVPNFVLAFHRFGVFDLEEIQTRNVQEQVKKWEKEHTDSVRQLAALLKLLIAFARDVPDGRFELVHEEQGRDLQLCEVCADVNRALPRALSDRWTNIDSAGNNLEVLSASDPEMLDEEAALGWDSESEKDYTACDAESCGYCGHCKY